MRLGLKRRLGIKRKVIVMLVGLLALTTAFNALLASYYTNRQNEQSAFTALDRSLRAWHDDLHAMTRRLKGAALSTVADTVVLNQLTELILLESPGARPQPRGDAVALARGLSYARAVSLNRLHLALRTSGFSRIAVYTGGKLSHAVSLTEAGMRIQGKNSEPVWVTTAADADGNLNMPSWPAWKQRPAPAGAETLPADAGQPTVSITFPSPEHAAIDIIVPVQGVFEEFLSDFQPRIYRLVSGMTIAGSPQRQPGNLGKGRRQTAAILVFSRLIDRDLLDAVAAKTGMAPVLFSPDGAHRLQFAGGPVIPDALARTAQTLAPGKVPAVLQHTVEAGQESFYAALLPWKYENRTRIVLGLSSSRQSTLYNIRETVTAILLASGLILVLSIAVGIYWVGRFIDPIVALTRAVKQIGRKRSGQFQFIPADAPDEIGELSAAFNVMTGELRRAFETLEQRVQARTAELRQQTRYLRTLIDTLPLWVWLKDTEQRYLAANRANADACGHSVDEMVGKTDEQLWPPELAERYRANDLHVMTTRERTTVEQAIAGENGLVWMETWRAPVLDEDGTLLGMVGAARNISERKAAEAARETALAEAVRLARQRSDFLAQMSHELRTPLNAIMGYAQLLRRHSLHLTEKQAAGLATIHDSGQHLLTLINDILDLARVEAGKMVLYPAPIELGGFLRVVADIIRVKADEKSLVFSCDAAPDLPAGVMMDDKRLRQVLLNLLGNAVKFTDAGSVALRVGLAQDQAGPALARLRFEVEDSGIGMSPEQMARVFQPFEQVADMPRREGGTGLGLAISQQLVQLMGGNIGVRSELGKGSLFWFELALPVASSTLAVRTTLRTIAGYQGPRKRLLIVDDVPQNRAMLMDTLHTLGFTVADARNGLECLSMLAQFKPDLLVIDVTMPVMDGHEAMRRIRQMPDWAHLPIIAVTASAGHEDELKCYAAGANAFIAKPIDIDILLDTIGAQLSLDWVAGQLAPEKDELGADAGENLVIPPAQEIEILFQLARIGNMQKISERADILQQLDPAYTPFARRLHALAQGYHSKALTAFVARYRAGADAPAAAP